MRNISTFFTKPAAWMWLVLLTLVSCRKDETFIPTGEINAPEYVYNTAIAGFQPAATVAGQFSGNFAVKTIYYYLHRDNATDSLLKVQFLADGLNEFDFELEPEVWQAVDFAPIRGVKILFVNSNQISLEKLLPITYFNPDAPQISGFPDELTPSLTGPTTVSGNITTVTGIQKVRFLDNRSGSFEAFDSIAGNNALQLSVNYAYQYADGAGQLRIEIIDIYGLTTEKVINFVGIPFRPVITYDLPEFTAALPDGGSVITGTIKTFAPLQSLKANAVTATGASFAGDVNYTLVGSAANEYNYTFSYSAFPYSDQTTQIRLEAIDQQGYNSTGDGNIRILPYFYWKEVTMMSQGLPNAAPPVIPNNSFFIGELNRPVIGSCDVVGNNSFDQKIEFLLYTTSTGNVTIYNPNNATNIRGNYVCEAGGSAWSPASVLDYRIRVLLQTTASNGSGVYTRFNSGQIPSLDASFFTGVNLPSGNTARFDGVSNPAATVFDPVNAYLIWIRANNGTANILLRVKSVDKFESPNQGLSSIVVDIYKQR